MRIIRVNPDGLTFYGMRCHIVTLYVSLLQRSCQPVKQRLSGTKSLIPKG